MIRQTMRQLGVLGALCALAVGGWASQNKLASIMIGMSPQQVRARLGEPTGILLPQPPVIPHGSHLSDLAQQQADGILPEIFERLPAIMLYRYQKNGKWIEYEIDTGISMLVSEQRNGIPVGKLPAWAYPIRVGYLGLDQQQYLYRINSTYSLGVVLTGEGAEARVTDIVAASLEPFLYRAVAGSVKKIPLANKLDMFYKPKKLDLSAGTSLGVIMGASFARVLQRHGWPDVFIPFVTNQAAEYKLSSTDKEPNVSTISGIGATGVHAGVDKIRIYNPNGGFNLETGFTNNFMLLYVDHGVAITVIDMTVVRLHIGQGVRMPPVPNDVNITPGGAGQLPATPIPGRMYPPPTPPSSMPQRPTPPGMPPPSSRGGYPPAGMPSGPYPNMPPPGMPSGQYNMPPPGMPSGAYPGPR